MKIKRFENLDNHFLNEGKIVKKNSSLVSAFLFIFFYILPLNAHATRDMVQWDEQVVQQIFDVGQRDIEYLILRGLWNRFSDGVFTQAARLSEFYIPRLPRPVPDADSYVNRGPRQLRTEFMAYFTNPAEYSIYRFRPGDQIADDIVFNLDFFRIVGGASGSRFRDRDLHYVVTYPEDGSTELIIGFGDRHLTHAVLANWTPRLPYLTPEERLDFIMSDDPLFSDSISNNPVLAAGTMHIATGDNGADYLEYNNFSGHFQPLFQSLEHPEVRRLINHFTFNLVQQNQHRFVNLVGTVMRAVESNGQLIGSRNGFFNAGRMFNRGLGQGAR